MVYLEDRYLGMPKILSKYKRIILLHITTDVFIYLNDIMTCVTQMDIMHYLSNKINPLHEICFNNNDNNSKDI